MFPHLIAFCGNPTAGKTEAQLILDEQFGVNIIDSGQVLRVFAMRELGLSEDDVTTQAGKLRKTVIADREWEHRQILGDFGVKLEEMFGENFLPWVATRNLDPKQSYSIALRRGQAHFIKKLGAIAIGINNPLAPASKYEFDRFDPTAIDFWVENDGLAKGMSKAAARRDLAAKLTSVLWQKDAA